MQITELERAVLKKMISDLRSPSNKPSIDLGMVRVKERHYTGAGFLTEFILTEDLKLCSEDVTMRWGNIGAKLNSSNIETGYLGYIDNGYLTALEGYTYGEPWPEHIEHFALYDLPLPSVRGRP